LKIILLIPGVLVFLFLAGVFKYLRIIMNVFLNIPLKAMYEHWPLTSGEEVSFLSLKGHPLKGVFFKGEAAEKGTIIFCHEFGADKSFCAPYNSFLLKNGYNVFSFDFRSHGQSLGQDGYIPRPWTTQNEIDDLLGAVRYIEKNGGKNSIGVLGISRGAATAITSIRFAPGIKAIVSDSAFSTLETMIGYMQKWVAIFSSLRFVNKRMNYRSYSIMAKMSIKMAELKYRLRFPSLTKALEKHSIPILFIHGKQDSFIGYKHAEFLYEKSPGPKAIWLIEKARHNEGIKVAPEQYARNVVNFFDKHLTC
jgi:fermentation-respiration switch protein FrsA (DUF1100 family)